MKNKKQKILIAGGTGIVGTILKNHFEKKGMEVYILTRSENPNPKYLRWDPVQEFIDPHIKSLTFDAVINTTGAGIAESRWTKKRKKILLESRTIPIRFLWKMIHESIIQTQDFLCITAVGIYGNNENPVDESDTLMQKDDFMSRLCRQWEKEFTDHKKAGVTTSILRLGVVITPKGGFIEPFLFPIRVFAAPYFGNGKNQISWIEESDVAAATYYILNKNPEERKDTYNLTAPASVNSRQFSKSMIEVFNPRAVSFPVPSLVLKIIFGEMSAAILSDAQILPTHLLQSGYRFKTPDINTALTNTRNVLKKQKN